MKALRYEGKKDMRYVDLPIPGPKEYEVRIKVKAVAICGSDLNGYKGINGLRIAPLVMGHEFSGEIDCCGEGVDGLKPGLKVTVNPNFYCGECSNCRNGKFNLCNQKIVPGTSVGGVNVAGAMAEYICVRAKNIIPLAEQVSFEEGALLEPLAVSLHGVKRGGKIQGKKIVVVGSGPIGLMAAMLAKNMGASQIINTDVLEERLRLAKLCGATDVVNLKNRQLSCIRELTAGEGADVVFDCVGNEQSVNQAAKTVKNGGKIVVIGMASEEIMFPVKKFVAHELELLGSYQYVNEMQEAMELVADHKIDLSHIMTSIVPLSDGKEAFERLCLPETNEIKIILKP